MPDPVQPPSNGAASANAEAPKSLRDVLEASWEEVVEDAPEPPDEGDQPVDSGGQPRDEGGRWVRKDAQPGEAEPPARPEHPAPQEQPQPPEAHPAPIPGVAAQPPDNWSAEDRAAFSEQSDRGKAFLLRRHSELEGEFQRRVQANATAANFAQSLSPIFNDPVISGSLRQAGVTAHDAISQWAGFHHRFITDPAGMVRDLVQRAQLDPAAIFGPSPAGSGGPLAGLPEAVAKDPAMKVIADYLGRTTNDVTALRGELQAMRADGENRQQAEVARVTRWGIDSFAEEKDAQGNLTHPHFDAVLPHIIDLFRANPQRDLREAYETALWMDNGTRTGLLQSERSRLETQQSNQRAAQAVRSNARGRTSPVSPPARSTEGKPRSIRDVLEETADQVGFE